MAKQTKNVSSGGESFMVKLSTFIVDKRNLFFLITIILVIFSMMGKRTIGILFGKVHRNLTSLHNLTFSGACLNDCLIQIEIITYDFLNHLNRELFFLQTDSLTYHTFCQRQIYFLIINNSIRHQ